ncbi:MAG: TldD/PmbA family protein [Chloroflexi bacterium]|nr:TldD/PmbA family protein [Chloroflexota bacterium]
MTTGERDDTLSLCADIVARARVAGADEAEAYCEASTTTTVDARATALESLTQASSRAVGVRVLVGGALGQTYGSDLDTEGRATLAEGAVQLARLATPDPLRTLPMPEDIPAADLGIYDTALIRLAPDTIVTLLAELEETARAADPRVQDTHFARFQSVAERVTVVNSRGVAASYAATGCSVALSVIARANGEAQRGHASSIGRGPGDLDIAETGRRAARRATLSLGGGLMPTRRATVVLDPEIVAEWLRGLVQALAGDAVVKGRSVFATRKGSGAEQGAGPWLGQHVGSPLVTLEDVGNLPGGPATAPVDGEGVPTRATRLIEQGVLRGFLHNTESAVQVGVHSTGNAVRASYRAAPEVGPTNLRLLAGDLPPDEIVRGVDDGLYVIATRNVGGINPVSGDYSVGASGRRIVRGELTEPVSGVAIAASLLDVLAGVAAVGSDPRWSGGQGAVYAPTVRVDGVTIGGS